MFYTEGLLALFRGAVDLEETSLVDEKRAKSKRGKEVDVSEKPKSKSRVLRSRRVSATDLLPGLFCLRFRYEGEDVVIKQVEDLSLHGFAIVVPESHDVNGLFLNGQRLDQVNLECNDISIYRGSAIIRYVGAVEEGLRLGLQTEGLIDLPRLYGAIAGHDFSARWQEIQDDSLRCIPASFKGDVVGLRVYLQKVRRLLKEEDNSLLTEDLPTRRKVAKTCFEEAHASFVDKLNCFSKTLNALYVAMPRKDKEVLADFCREHLHEFYLESRAVSRAHHKPLGYPGDYELMNMFYRDDIEDESLFGKLISAYMIEERAGYAIRNRLLYFQKQIRKAIASKHNKGRTRIVSIGCGPAQEIFKLLEASPELGKRLEVILVDQEERAVRYCENMLGPFIESEGLQVRFVREPIKRLVLSHDSISGGDSCDLVYSGGLFDYIEDRAFVHLVKNLWKMVREDGQLIIGNMAPGNSSRGIMECMVTWFLKYRSESELEKLGKRAVPDGKALSVESEDLGINLFLTLQR